MTTLPTRTARPLVTSGGPSIDSPPGLSSYIIEGAPPRNRSSADHRHRAASRRLPEGKVLACVAGKRSAGIATPTANRGLGEQRSARPASLTLNGEEDPEMGTGGARGSPKDDELRQLAAGRSGRMGGDRGFRDPLYRGPA